MGCLWCKHNHFYLEEGKVFPLDYHGSADIFALNQAQGFIYFKVGQAQIEEGELSGNWCPVLGENNQDAQIFLYDLLPGGAGYTRLVKQRLIEVLDETEKLLDGCDCETSCYRCLRHYGNNYYHASLDRKLAHVLLKFIKYGEYPDLSNKVKRQALDPLLDLLRLKQVEVYPEAERLGVQIPLVIRREDHSEIWVDVHCLKICF